MVGVRGGIEWVVVERVVRDGGSGRLEEVSGRFFK